MIIDNIIAQADVQKQQEYRIFLCKMNREIIREITKQSYSKSYSPQLGGADSFSFSIAKEYDGVLTKNYDDIVGRNMILVKQLDTPIGYFEIQDAPISTDGVSEVKNVSTLSAEIKLIHKKIFLTEGVFKLQNDANPTSGILNVITSLAPSWNIGYIDFELINKQRYFDIVDSNVYELLINQIQDTFECVVIFDTNNKTINAYALSNFGEDSKIILSLDNVLESAKKSETSSDIVTRLHLYGSNELTVRDINFGQPWVQNYGYFKNTRFMSQSLITALNNYDIVVNNNTTTYNNYLASLQTLNGQLVTANADLLTLENELKSLLEQRAYLQSINQSTSSIQIQINNKYIEIATKNGQISSITSTINSIYTNINSLLEIISFENNFTQAQIEELDNFVIEDTYQDSAFLTTDTMTYNEQVAIQQQLLTAGKNMLARISYPRYKIDIDVIDFLKLTEYVNWWGELNVGDLVRLDIGDGIYVQVRVVGYTHDWDGNGLTIQLGDRYQLDDANIDLLELIKSSISAGTSIDFKKYQFEDYDKNGKNEILNFINSSIDVSKNAIISGTNVGIRIDTSGILATALIPNTTTISPKQLRISNNGIVISDDGFVTAKTAIGQLVNGQYGIAAEVIAGKMILGNNMIIETGSGDFRVDGNGVSITKMALSLTSTDNLKKILLDPNVGFKIQSRPNVSQSFVDKFFVDSNGQLKYKGILEASDMIGGTITGTTISGVTINGTTINGGTVNGASINAGSGAGLLKMYTASGVGVLEFSSGLTIKPYLDGILIGSSILADPNILIRNGAIDITSASIDLNSNNISMDSVPYILNENSYLATQDWTIARIDSDLNDILDGLVPYLGTEFVKKGSGTTVDTLGTNSSQTKLYVLLTNGVLKEIDFTG